MKSIWFVRKSYGRGRTPSTWQGWLVLLVFLLLYIPNRFRVGEQPERALLVEVIVESLVLITILIIICYKKGEKPKRQRGKKK